MFCKNCGASLNESDMFCKECGTKVEREVQEEVNQPIIEEKVEDTKVENIVEEATTDSVVEQEEVSQPVIEEKNEDTKAEDVVEETTVNPVAESKKVEENNTTSKPKKDLRGVNKGGLIVCIVIVLLFFGFIVINILGGVIALLSVDWDNLESNSNSGTYQIKNLTEEEVTVNGKETTPVLFEGFKFFIPVNLDYEMYDDEEALYIGDKEEWASKIEIVEESFSTILENKSEIKTLYDESYDVSTPKEKDILGVKLVYSVLTDEDGEMLAVLVKANARTTFSILLVDMNSDEVNENLLYKIAPIIKVVKYVGESSNSNKI